MLVALTYDKGKNRFSVITLDLIIPNQVQITAEKSFTASHQTLYEGWQGKDVYTKGHEFRIFNKDGNVERVVPYQELFIPGLKPYVAIHGQVGTLGCVQVGSKKLNGSSEVIPQEYEDSILKNKHIILHPASLMKLTEAAGAKPMDRQRTKIGSVRVIR